MEHPINGSGPAGDADVRDLATLKRRYAFLGDPPETSPPCASLSRPPRLRLLFARNKLLDTIKYLLGYVTLHLLFFVMSTKD